MRIRLARMEDLARLRDIERAASELFAEIGMDAVATDEPLSLETLASYQKAGRAWAQTPSDDHVAAYIIVDVVDGAAHIEQVSVDPSYAHRRLGRDLIEHVAQWAAEQSLSALTLTTFTDVAWNGPYYERLGFRFLAESELSPGLRAIQAQEASHGLDTWPRACMRRSL